MAVTYLKGERIPDVKSDFDPNPRWVVGEKRADGYFEVSVCHTSEPHGLRSWGWTCSAKIEIMGRSFEDAKRRAEIIAKAFNEARIVP